MTSLSSSQPIGGEQQSQPKEQSQFFLSNDFYKSLLYFQLHYNETSNEPLELDEQKIKEPFRTNELIQNLIQSIYVLYGNKSLLIVAKDSVDVDLTQLEYLIQTHVTLENVRFERKELPDTFGATSQASPLLITTEINDSQLELISKEKYLAIKTVEAKTGLKLKKIKKSIYFSGLLFQFNILNQLLLENAEKNAAEIKVTPKSNTTELVSVSVETKSTESPISSSDVSPSEKPINDWKNLYAQSSIRYNFKLKPKLLDLIKPSKSSTTTVTTSNENSNLDTFEYDVYIFHADLTELNTDGLVNATNPNLHPGYDGEGIARRIREKAGKQMADACKRILKEDRKNVVFSESEVVHTKAYGKLKAKYVLHAVAPTWSKYVLDESNLEYKFEPLLEQTFNNVMKIAHDPKLKLNSIAFPMASSCIGGAFDVPLELCSHTLYTQLADFKLDNNLNTNLKTICITSLEENTVKTLCEIFSSYNENYSTTPWAIPLSPMIKLLQQHRDEKKVNHTIKTQTLPSPHSKPVPFANNTNLNEANITNKNFESSNVNKDKNENTYSKNTPQTKLNEPKENININKPERTFRNNKITISNTKPSDDIIITNYSDISSTNESRSHENSNKNQPFTQKIVRTISGNSATTSLEETITVKLSNVSLNPQRHIETFCLLCQEENNPNLISCGNQDCKRAFCRKCLLKYLQNSQKCPGCKHLVDQNFQINLRDDRSSSSSSSSPNRNNNVPHINESLLKRLDFSTSVLNANNPNNRTANRTPNYNTNTNYSHNQTSTSGNGGFYHGKTNNSNPINNKHLPNNQPRMRCEVIDEPCDGYEGYRSLLITFEIPDGVHNGQSFKGLFKRVYLPEIKECDEILAFFERALKSDLLFKVDLSRKYGDFRVLLGNEITLKTELHGGGRFGFPDPKYVEDLLRKARSFK